MATVPQWMLRRLAPRALRVLERQESREPALAAHRGRVGVSAQDFINAYDDVSTFTTSSGPSRSGRNESIEQLRRKLSGWTPLVAGDLPGFDRSEFAADETVADDLFQRVERLLKIVERQATDGVTLPYAENLATDLGEALAAAKEDAKVVGTSSSEEADLRAAARDAADRFHDDLISFRRTLRAHVGRSHPEYQKLRVARVRSTDADDDAMSTDLLDEYGSQPQSPDETDTAAIEDAADTEADAQPPAEGSEGADSSNTAA